MEERYEGQSLVQAYNHQAKAKENFDRLNAQLQEAACRAETASGKVNPITDLVNNLGYVLSAVLGYLSVLSGNMLLGDVQPMLQYTKQFSQPFPSIAGLDGSFGAARAAAGRIFALLDADLILYMEHGDIKEAGNHKSLLALQGRYAALYQSQFA